MNFLSRAWYRQSAWLWLLLPLSLVVRYVAVRRLRTLQKASKSGHIEALSCPVIVVGNLTVVERGRHPSSLPSLII